MRRQLTTEHVEHIRRTVNRAPEVMVKVLGRGSNDLKAVARHLDYIGRKGELALESDHGEPIQGRDGKVLLEDWDLDIDEVRQQASLAIRKRSKPPKIVHKLMFSMPPGTPPQKVEEAVRNFAREEFAFQHRYVLVLHTDEPHPHVHVVLKAMSEEGVRLNIRKATLRHWRSQFARHLRLLGVSANATERAVRGENRKAKKDAIYRAIQRGASTYVRRQTEAVSRELLTGGLHGEVGQRDLGQTRKRVVLGWHDVMGVLAGRHEVRLATEIRQFVREMPAVRSERELLADELMRHLPDRRSAAPQIWSR